MPLQRFNASTVFLFSRVMGRGRFRFGRLFGGLALGFDPLSVKNTWLIYAFVRVRTKEIALRLQEIRRKSRLAITIEIGKRC